MCVGVRDVCVCVLCVYDVCVGVCDVWCVCVMCVFACARACPRSSIMS